MLRNEIGEDGFVSTGPRDGTFKTVIQDYARLPRYEAHTEGPITVSGSFVHGLLPFNTRSLQLPSSSLYVWDDDTSRFLPSSVGEVYTMKVDGIVPTAGLSQDPVFHIDFEVSGVIEVGAVSVHGHESINRQSADLIVTTGGNAPDHHHYHAIFVVITTADMVASGAQFYAASSGPSLQFLSSSLVIKEG